MADKRRAHTTPWKHTEKDRGWMRRKAAADERAASHVYDPARCKPGCAAKPKGKVMREVIEPQLAVLTDRLNAEFAPDGISVKWADNSRQTFERETYFTADDWAVSTRAATKAMREFGEAADRMSKR